MLIVLHDIARPEMASGCTAEQVDDTDCADYCDIDARNQVERGCWRVRGLPTRSSPRETGMIKYATGKIIFVVINLRLISLN